MASSYSYNNDISLTCHCGLTSLSLRLATSTPGSTNPSLTLPLPAYWNYSPYYTRITGSPFTLLAVSPHEPSPSSGDPDTNPAPAESPELPGPQGTSWIRSYFCVECGTVLYLVRQVQYLPGQDEGVEEVQEKSGTRKEYLLLAGALARGDEKKVEIKGHVGVEGSPFTCFSFLFHDNLPRFADVAGKIPWDASVATTSRTNDLPAPTPDAVLSGGCACGGITFTIASPASIPPTDTTTHNWIKPTPRGQKLCGNICFCHTCRRVSGAVAWVWMFTPLSLLRVLYLADTDSLPKNPPGEDPRGGIDRDGYVSGTKDGTVHRWHYSSGVQGEGMRKGMKRHWCGRCGCSLFYQAQPANYGDEMWDVAVGCLRNSEAQGDGKRGWRNWVVTRFGDGEAEGKRKEEWDVRRADRYIGQWVDGEMSYEVDGLECWPEVVEMVKKGVEKGGW